MSKKLQLGTNIAGIKCTWHTA